ncbi:MBL fold metallo-hydrolase [Pseudomonas sp. CC120222-01a]|uniref:MBL fold metallo-hydrolase n=1 Tax=Pseudomonas sp. CC120222-01a TaxID=1378075 RepID=UPI000D906ED4|nr:MBL fold metallo-hydrolase [Pseudomonas sp. CC120222-01a]PVZ41018.1 metallo-beta-lactamase superfamily protein [Pseudomonas sp. CC120222-01a]
MLPAREGDAIWVRWGDTDNPYQMLVDMGTEEVGRLIWQEISRLPESQRTFEAVVVTHIDADHIGGLLSCFVDQEQPSGVLVKDFWFNGYAHLEAKTSTAPLESLGAVQGERLTKWLLTQSWNRSFGGDAICRRDGEPLRTVELPGGMQVTVLGPTVKRLNALKPQWEQEIRIATQKAEKRGSNSSLEALGGKRYQDISDISTLRALAKQRPMRDSKAANGSSVILLLEYEGKRILLAGDAFADDLADAISYYSSSDNLKLDAFKVSHHCSRGNITERLIKAIDCQNWLISTDGTRHKHPDDEGVASILYYKSGNAIKLFFNVSSERNEKWSNPTWKSRFNYSAEYGSTEKGYTLEF